MSLFCRLWSISIIETTFDNIIKKSNFIVRGNIRSEDFFTRDGHIWTRYEFLISEFIRGSGPSIIFFEQPGGRSGDIVTNVAGIRNFSPGEHLCLFLWADPKGSFQVMGFTEGCFELKEDADGILRIKNFNSKKSVQNILFSRNKLGKEEIGVYEKFQQTRSWEDFKILIRDQE
jgi:hypothetical protein